MYRFSVLKIIVVYLFLTSCSSEHGSSVATSSPEKQKNQPASSSEKTVVKDSIISTPDTISQNLISGHVVYTNSYCGGVAPPPEVIKQYEITRPLKNSTIRLVRKNSKDQSIQIVTDDNGNFSEKLEPGTYKFYMTRTFSKKSGVSFNASCDVWLKKSFGEIKITQDKKTDYEIFFAFECNPCEPPRP